MILVDINVPAIDDQFDFLIDEDTEINQVIVEICSMLKKKNQSDTVGNMEEFALYDLKQRVQLNKSKTLSESNIVDGSDLLLV